MGEQLDPLSSELGQGDAIPKSIEPSPSHGLGEQVAGISDPKLQEDDPNPALQVGWHVDPHAREFVQLPRPPVAGTSDALH